MVTTRLARVLLLLGAGLGIAGVVVAALDLRVNIPDWMIQVAMIKLALAGSLGLLGAGALLGRHAKRQASLGSQDRLALGEANPDLDKGHAQRSVSEQLRQFRDDSPPQTRIQQPPDQE
jgi:hypothetical protein